MLLSKIGSAIYDDCVNILETILASDDKKIVESRNMQGNHKLPHGHTRIVPYTTLDSYQRDAK